MRFLLLVCAAALTSCVAHGLAPERPIISWQSTSSMVCPEILRSGVSYTCSVTIDFTQPEYILDVSEMKVHSDQFNTEALPNIIYPLNFVTCTNMTSYQSCKYDLPFNTTRGPFFHTLTVSRNEKVREGIVVVPRTVIVQTTTKSGFAAVPTLFAMVCTCIALVATAMLI